MLVDVLTPHTYDDRARRVGERYEASPQFLPLLVALRWVALADQQSTIPPAAPPDAVDDSDGDKPTRRGRKPRFRDLDTDPAA